MTGAGRPSRTRVELLYFTGCPTYLEAEQTLREVLEEGGVDTDVTLVPVDTDEEARRLRFPGNPTVRIDGRDPFPTPERSWWGLACRVYATPEGPKGAPTAGMLRDALGLTGRDDQE